MRAGIFRPKGTSPKSVSDFNSEWADRIALLILVGLLVDIAALFISDKSSWRMVLAITGDILIIAGVWGELWFAKRAREADDGRVAEAERAVAAANERAAKLEKEAADARERTAEIERVTAWRTISEEQHHNIVDAIRGKSNPPLDILIEWERGDSEAYMYAWQIAKLLEDARGEKIRGSPNSYLNWQGFGVYAHADPTIDLPAIINAFTRAGVIITPQDREEVRRLSWGPPNWGALYIFVAAKLPPHFEQFANAKPESNANAAINARE